jgi:cell division protein FtsZ
VPKRRDEGTVLRREKPQATQAEVRAAATQINNQASPLRPATQAAPAAQPVQAAQPTQPTQPARPARPVQFDDDELDVPDFLK